jgi:hypothetical protein
MDVDGRQRLAGHGCAVVVGWAWTWTGGGGWLGMDVPRWLAGQCGFRGVTGPVKIVSRFLADPNFCEQINYGCIDAYDFCEEIRPHRRLAFS